MPDSRVALCFDFDAVSPWIHTFGANDSPTKLSRGLLGVDVGAPRILRVLNRTGVSSTWFVPGHTIDSFPEATQAVVDGGHDIQCHGWSHTNPSEYPSKAAERDDLERAMTSIHRLTGDSPTGYRSPSWDYSIHTLELLEELGFDWSSSLMGREFEPYFARKDWSAEPDRAYERGTETDMLEFPVSWFRDDWIAFQYTLGERSQGPRADEAACFEMWRRQFSWMHEHVDGGLFTLTMHPQITGIAPRVEYLEELIRDLQAEEGVEFCTLDAAARQHD